MKSKPLVQNGFESHEKHRAASEKTAFLDESEDSKGISAGHPLSVQTLATPEFSKRRNSRSYTIGGTEYQGGSGRRCHHYDLYQMHL